MKQSFDVAVFSGATANRHVRRRLSESSHADVGQRRRAGVRAKRDTVARREDAVTVAAREVANAVDKAVVQAVGIVQLDAAPLTADEVDAADVPQSAGLDSADQHAGAERESRVCVRCRRRLRVTLGCSRSHVS